MKFPFLLNKTYHEWPKPFISESELRKVGNIHADMKLYWKVQGQDELITGDNSVDLAREGIEQIYSVASEKYQFIINGKLFVSFEPVVTESELRTIGKIAAEDIIFLKVEGADREITKNQQVDLRPYPIEEFYTISGKLVQIKIDNKPYKVKPGKYSVAELKKVGGVKPSHDLDQLIDGKLVPLNDNGHVVIKGGEEFKSHPNDGSSS